MLRRIQNYLANEGAKLIILVLWLGMNAFLFYCTFKYYYYGREFYYLHEMLGYGLCISRATAACINLNACLILFPMCRNVVGFLRGFPTTRRVMRRLLDKSRSFHISCGYMLCLMAGIHCGAHCFNAFNFSKQFNERYPDVNVAAFANQNPIVLVVTSVPGLTGLFMVIILLTISISASSRLRRENYRRFWKLHHLFIVFYLLLLLHASRGILKYQSNTTEHVPGCYVRTDGKMNATVTIPEPEPKAEPSKKMIMVSPESEPIAPDLLTFPEGEPFPHPLPEGEPESFNFAPCHQAEPRFRSCPTEAWRWMMIPLILYMIERLSRYLGTAGKPLSITKVKEHPNDVIEIEFFDPNFKAKPGQSICLRCPQMSADLALESHPFTLTAVPTVDHPYFTVHMKVLGEWTRNVRDILNWQSLDSRLCKNSARSNRDDNVLESVVCYDVIPTTMAAKRREDPSHVEKASDNNKLNCMDEDRTRISLSTNMNGADLSKDHRGVRLTLPQDIVLHASGPYGSAMQDVFRYSTTLCVAGGIGITPFASILNMILRKKDCFANCKLSRVYLVWICKTIKSFEWFIELIHSVQSHLWNSNKPDFLNVYLHVTMAEEEERAKMHSQYPQLQRCRLELGRPVFQDLFNELSNRHQKSAIGVFCCGPRSLNHSVQRHCLQTNGSASANGTQFIFNKESF